MSKTRDRRVPAARFKAQCLALLDEVESTRRPIVVTKRGRPVAKLVPLTDEYPDLRGSVLWEADDIITPFPEDWDCEK